jgi:hypothetical protein
MKTNGIIAAFLAAMAAGSTASNANDILASMLAGRSRRSETPRNNRKPHQGAREIERRKRQMERLK